MPKNIIIALQAVKPWQVVPGASSLQVLDKFSENFANRFLKSKNPKGRGVQNILDKIFKNFELPKNKCSWHCSHSLLVFQSISAVSFPD